MTKDANNVFSISNSCLGSKQKTGARGSGGTPNFKAEFQRSSLNLRKTREIVPAVGGFAENGISEKRLFSKKSSTTLDAAMKNKLQAQGMRKEKGKRESPLTIEAALRKIKSVESVSEGEAVKFRHGSTIENHFNHFEIVSVSEKDAILDSGTSTPLSKTGLGYSGEGGAPKKIKRGLLSESDCSVILKTSETGKTETPAKLEPQSWRSAHRRLKKNNTHRLDGNELDQQANQGGENFEKPGSQLSDISVEKIRDRKLRKFFRQDLLGNDTKKQLSPNRKMQENPLEKPRKNGGHLKQSGISSESGGLRLSNLISKLPKESRFFSQNGGKKQSKLDQLISSKIQKNLSNSQPRREALNNREAAVLKHKESLIPNNINLSFANTSNAHVAAPRGERTTRGIGVPETKKRRREKANRSGISINTIDSVYVQNRTHSANQITTSGKNTLVSNRVRVTKYSVEEYNRLSSRSASLTVESTGKRVSRRIVALPERVLSKKKSLVSFPRIVRRTIRSRSEDAVPVKAPSLSGASVSVEKGKFSGHCSKSARLIQQVKVPRKVIQGPRRRTVKYLTLDKFLKENFAKTHARPKENVEKIRTDGQGLRVLKGKVRTISLNQKIPEKRARNARPQGPHTPKHRSVFSRTVRKGVSVPRNKRNSPERTPFVRTGLAGTSKSLPVLKKFCRQSESQEKKPVQFWRGLRIIKGPTVVKKVITPSDPEYIKIIDANIRYGKKLQMQRTAKAASRKEPSHQTRGFTSTNSGTEKIAEPKYIREQKENCRTSGNRRKSLRKCKSALYRENKVKAKKISQTCEFGSSLMKLLSNTNQSIQVNTARLGKGHFPPQKPMQKKIRSKFYNKYKNKAVKVGEIDSEIHNSITKMNLDTITERMMDNLSLLMRDPAVREQINLMGLDRRKFPLKAPGEPRRASEGETQSAESAEEPDAKFNLAVIQPNVVMNIQTGLQNVNCQWGSKCLHLERKEKENQQSQTSVAHRIKNQQGFFYKFRRKRNASTNTESGAQAEVRNEGHKYKIKEIVSMVAEQIAQNKESPEELQTKLDKSVQISRVLETLIGETAVRAKEKPRPEESLVFESNKRVLGSRERQFCLAHEIETDISPFFRKGAKKAKPAKQTMSGHKAKNSSRERRVEHPFQLKISAHMKNYLHSEVQASDSGAKPRTESRKERGTDAGRQRKGASEEVEIADTQIINQSIRQMGREEAPREEASLESREFASCVNGGALSRANGSFLGAEPEGESKMDRFFSSKNISEVEYKVLSKMAKKAQTIEIERGGDEKPSAEGTLRKLPSESIESRVRTVGFDELREERQKHFAAEKETPKSGGEGGRPAQAERAEETRRKRFERITSDSFNNMIQFQVDNRVRHEAGGATETFKGLSKEILRGEDTHAPAKEETLRRRAAFLNNVRSLNRFNSASDELGSGKGTPPESRGEGEGVEKRDLCGGLEEIAEKTESNSKSQQTESQGTSGQGFYSSSRKKWTGRKESSGPRNKFGAIEEEPRDLETGGTGLREVQSGSTFFVGTREVIEAAFGANQEPSLGGELQTTLDQNFEERISPRETEGQGEGKEIETGKGGENKKEEREAGIETRDSRAQKRLFNRRRLEKRAQQMGRNLTFGGQKPPQSKSCSNSFQGENTGQRSRMISFKGAPDEKKPDKEHPRINVDALEGTFSESSEESLAKDMHESEEAFPNEGRTGLLRSETKSLGKSNFQLNRESEARYFTAGNEGALAEEGSGFGISKQSFKAPGKADKREEAQVRPDSRELKGPKEARKANPKETWEAVGTRLLQRRRGEERRSEWYRLRNQERKLGYSRVCSPKSSVFLKEFNRDVEQYSSKSLVRFREKLAKTVCDKKRPAKKGNAGEKGGVEAKKTVPIWTQLRRNKQENFSKLRKRRQKKNIRQKTGGARKAPRKSRLRVETPVPKTSKRASAYMGKSLRVLKTPKGAQKRVSFKQFSRSMRKSPLAEAKKTITEKAKTKVKAKIKGGLRLGSRTEKLPQKSRNLTTLGKLSGSRRRRAEGRRRRGNFTTIDDFSNNFRQTPAKMGASFADPSNARRRVKKLGSNKSTLVKLCKPNFSAQTSLAEIKNKIRGDLQKYFSGNMSTRGKLPQSRILGQAAEQRRVPEQVRVPALPIQAEEAVQILVSGLLWAEFEELLWVERSADRCNLESIREENDLLTQQDTFSVKGEVKSGTAVAENAKKQGEGSPAISRKEKDSPYVGDLQSPAQSDALDDAKSEFRRGVHKEISGQLAEIELAKFRKAFFEDSKIPEKTQEYKVAEWKVRTWEAAPYKENFSLKIDRRGKALNVEQVLSAAAEVAKAQKNVFSQRPSKVCGNLYITELELHDLVLLRGGLDSALLEVANPKALFPLLMQRANSIGQAACYSSAKQPSQKSPGKTQGSDANSNFYRRVLTEEVNASALTTTNREHFSFSQIQDQRPSLEKTGSRASRAGSGRRVSLRYFTRDSSELGRARGLRSNNVTSLHNSKKLLKGLASNSSKKYSLYERTLRGGALTGFADGRCAERRNAILLDFAAFERLLVLERWSAGDRESLRERRALFDFLFAANGHCSVLAKFTNCRFVFYRDSLELLAQLCGKWDALGRFFRKEGRAVDAEAAHRLARSLNLLSPAQKAALQTKESLALLRPFFQDKGTDMLKLAEMKLASLPKTSLKIFLSEEGFLDDFRVFWSLLLNRRALLEPQSSEEKRRSGREAIARVGLSPLGKKKDSGISPAELEREKRRTKIEFKVLQRKINFIFEHDLETYFSLKQNGFSRSEVASAFKKLRTAPDSRDKGKIPAQIPENCFLEKEDLFEASESASKRRSLHAEILSPAPKSSKSCAPVSGERRHCKSLSKLGKIGKGSLRPDSDSARRKFLSKKSLSVEKGRQGERMNKWLKKPEDIGNCGRRMPVDMRGLYPRDTFSSDQRLLDSLGSGFQGRKDNAGRLLTRPSPTRTSGIFFL